MRRLSDDDGVMVVMVGVLLILFLVVVALVADTGRVYDERGQLQHGADAAALAIAFDCARDAASCDASSTSVAAEYLNANAKDALSAIDPTSPLPLNPFIDFDARTVTVDALSQEPGQAAADGAVTLSLERSDGTTQAPVRARAIATWGSLSSGSLLPVTASMCDFMAALGWDPGDGDPPDELFPSGNVVIAFHDTSGAGGGSDCDAHPGHDTDGDGRLPGGFGELEIDAPCSTRVTAMDPDDPSDPEAWVYQDPGGNFSNVKACLVIGEVYAIPVFIDICHKNDGTCPAGVEPKQGAYGVGGFAMLKVSGWRFPGNQSTPKPKCPGVGNSGSCISGSFVSDIVPVGELGPVLHDFGARHAKIIG